MTRATRNPVWTRDETILALDLYLRRRPVIPDVTDQEVVGLSELLRAAAAADGRIGTESFRNPTGVSMKLGNLRRLDRELGTKGLSHGARQEDEVWSLHLRDAAEWPHEVGRARTRLIAAAASSE